MNFKIGIALLPTLYVSDTCIGASDKVYKVTNKIEFDITSFPSLKMEGLSLFLCLTGLALSQGGKYNITYHVII